MVAKRSSHPPRARFLNEIWLLNAFSRKTNREQPGSLAWQTSRASAARAVSG
jgi:hypothetical protein